MMGQLPTNSHKGCLRNRRRFCRTIRIVGLILFLAIFLVNFTILVNKSNFGQISLPERSLSSIPLTGLSRRNNLKVLQESIPKTITIDVLSSKKRVVIAVDGATIVESNEEGLGRGVHVLVLHQETGAVMAQRVFDTYTPREDDALVFFLSMVSDGRIIIMAVKDEGTFSLKSTARRALQKLGSLKANEWSWRDMWAFIAIKKGHVYGEKLSKSPDFNSWATPLKLRAQVPLVVSRDMECNWPDTEENRRRSEFCVHIEGYGSVCSCDQPAPLVFTTEPVLNNQIHDVPVAIIASNRPQYLYRSLRSLLTAPGVNREMITVFIDGYYEEPMAVTRLFGLRGIQHTPLGVKNARISQHYKHALTSTFNIFPSAKYVIILEEDLDVSPDFFSFFSQTLSLLQDDPTIFCVSAWNDLGYEHTVKDPDILYRVESMPGLGWILKRDLYKEELEPNWPTPEKMWDWDMWMRLPDNMKNRECIIPDISRTFHFGSAGTNMNSVFQDHYFTKHAFSTLNYVEFKNVERLKKSIYEEDLIRTLKSAKVLENQSFTCDANLLVPENESRPTLFFIKMSKNDDFDTWLIVAKCLGVWDLDARGFHKGMWRLHIREVPVFIIGVPYSPYSIFKPDHIKPFSYVSSKKQKDARIKNRKIMQ